MAISLGKRASDSAWQAWLEVALEAGVDAVQVREKELEDGDLLRLVRAAVARLEGKCLVLVNSRLDIALAAGAHGVHLPAAGLPAEVLRRHGDTGDLLIGRSIHHRDEAARAKHEGCDYALFGPVKPTPSKPARRDLPLFEGLAQASLFGLPLLALGGIESPHDLDLAAAAGACGVAGIRAFAEAKSAAAIARRARELWPRAEEGA